MPAGDWRSKFKRLWEDLVPPQGQANTVQGELVRAAGKLKDEAFRNGNLNFGKNQKILCKFIRDNLKDPKVFSRDELEQIDKCVDRILDAEHPDISGPITCFHQLFEMTVRWCDAHPDLISRESDPALHI
jgi:hypothetical protein